MLLVVGSNGFVGRNIARCFRESGRPVCTASHRPDADLHLDLAQPETQLDDIQSRGIQYAVICSGITDVDRCRREPEATWAFNVERTTALIAALQARGIVVVFCSSDLVFTGDRGGYSEGEVPVPMTEYGRQKKAVEDFLASRSAPYAILRMSKLYGPYPSKGSMVHETLAALRSGTVRAATDQIIVPTMVDDIARTIMAIIDRRLTGVFHVSPHDRYFRYDFVQRLAGAAGIRDRIAACSLDDIAFLDPRPKNLWLEGSETESRTGVRPVELAGIFDTLVAGASVPAMATAWAS
jgi:dTDP-4-dehydrorhamnose reductase